jgi:single-strand DNA-binding protein
MASLNKVLLIGNLTRDPELRYTPGGSAVCEFGMAINRTYTSNNEKKEEVCFIDINVWGKQAETCSRYLQKGSPVFVEGRLQLDQWKDKETNQPRSRLRVVAERTQFLGNPGSRREYGEEVQGGGYPNQQQPVSQPFPQQNYNQQMPGVQHVQQQPVQPPPQQPQQPQQAPQGGPGGFTPQQPPPAGNDQFDPSIGSEDDIPF